MYILQRFFVHESLDGNTERIDSGIPYMQHIQVSEALYVKFENLTNPAFLWFYMYFQGSQVLLFLVDIASINSLPRVLHKWQCHALLSSDVQSRSLCSIFKTAQVIYLLGTYRMIKYYYKVATTFKTTPAAIASKFEA